MIPAFNITTFSKLLSVLFCVSALDSSINFYFFLWILYLKKPFYPYCFTPKITPLSLMIFSSKLWSLYSFPTFMEGQWEPITCSLVQVFLRSWKCPTIPIFNLNWHLRNKIQNFFLARIAGSNLIKNYYYIFPTEQTDEMIPAFNITTFSKLLSVLFCVSALDSLILLLFFYEFCIWKSHSIPTVLRPKSLLYCSWFFL